MKSYLIVINCNRDYDNLYRIVGSKLFYDALHKLSTVREIANAQSYASSTVKTV